MVMSPVHQVWPKPFCKGTVKVGKKTRQTVEEVGRQHQGMDRCGVAKSQRAVENREEMEETVCEIICGAPTTLAIKG